jgi:phosphoglycolate phosphatase-like HAD superfamily hydrolase
MGASRCVVCVALLLVCGPARGGPPAPLPSWNDGAARARIVAFVQAVTDPASPAFVPAPERIAAFDNDGTLWAEKPYYFPVSFAIDRALALLEEHPQWRHREPFATLAKDPQAPLSDAQMRILQAEIFAGSTPETFGQQVDAWRRTGRHPRFQTPYEALTYAPMRELLAWLAQRGFTTYISSGAETEFLRRFCPSLYGVPVERVIGTSMEMVTQAGPQGLALLRLDHAGSPLNEGPGKAIHLQRQVGRRPILAVGNSDGDIEMLQFARATGRPSLGILVRHDDAEREYAYDERAERAQAIAAANDWLVISMKDDFARVFAARP